MEDNKENSNEESMPRRSGGVNWKAGMQIFSQVSTWIIVPIVCALVFGKMLDTHFGTKPKIFLIFAGVGFLVTCFGFFRIIKDYVKNLTDVDKK